MKKSRSLPRILIVEDSVTFQEIYLEILGADYSVTIVDDKHTALAQLRTHLFDVALIDMRLREGDGDNTDGLDIAAFVRAHCPATAMILKSGFVTVADASSYRERIERLNFFAVLDKTEEGQIQVLRETVARAVAARLDKLG